MPLTTDFTAPPRAHNHAGRARRVGVELEFAAVSAARAAEVVAETFGGEIEEVNQHRFEIVGTGLGDFRAELDWSFLHGRSAGSHEDTGETLQEAAPQIGNLLKGVLGGISAAVVPCEIVCPPIEVGELIRIDGLLARLRAEGARGTREEALFAFGAQLNPDIAAIEADYLTAVLKAYMLLSPWLRREIDPDMMRRLLAYAQGFPAAYVDMLIGDGYWPDRAALIGDYLHHNPSRNRELDMLPLFAWFDGDTVRAAVPDDLIKARPTFHWRLPNAEIERSGWTITGEWARWCHVERLAENQDMLSRLGAEYRANAKRLLPRFWAGIIDERLGLA